jgi:hypothetical protein
VRASDHVGPRCGAAQRAGARLGACPAIIALVCSAGGLEALAEVLGGLPADLPASVIVLQRLRPDKPSRLAAILARSSKLSVAARPCDNRQSAGSRDFGRNTSLPPVGRPALELPGRCGCDSHHRSDPLGRRTRRCDRRMCDSRLRWHRHRV